MLSEDFFLYHLDKTTCGIRTLPCNPIALTSSAMASTMRRASDSVSFWRFMVPPLCICLT